MDVNLPILTQLPSSAALEVLADFKTDLLARSLLQLMLYDSNVALNPQITLANLPEAVFGGYARVVVAGFDGPYLDAQNNAFMTTPLAAFTCNGLASDTIYGAALLGTLAAGTQATATNAGTGSPGNYAPTFVLTNVGAKYQAPPLVHLTGAAGAGAAAHAVLNTDGTLASIVLDNPGNNAYTTFTVSIDPPLEVIVAGQLSPAGIPISRSTDAILTMLQVTQPSVAA